jgi:hypothetical protein
LVFDGDDSPVHHERGAFYTGWLFYHPFETPIHSIDLTAKIPQIYRQQLGLAPLVDPATGKSLTLESHARLQERNLALDDAQALRALYKKEKELEAVLESETANGAEKNEALRELEQIYEFKRRQAQRPMDNARRVAHAVRSAIARFHEHLKSAVGEDGGPHPVLRRFADHIEKHILIPSARYARHGGPNARAGQAGCLTYEPPPGVTWA